LEQTEVSGKVSDFKDLEIFMVFPTKVERFLWKKCAEILMHKGLRKPQAYPWICRGFSRIPDAQEISADRDKNRSI